MIIQNQQKGAVMEQGEKAVVTGRAGFIGSNLVDELVARGFAVTVIDDLSTGKIENIAKLIDDGQVELVEGSIKELALLQEAFTGADYVFHEAAIPSVPRSINNPLASHEANCTGTLNVLIAARDNGVKKVVFASSSSVYGDTPALPKVETMIPNPRSPYAVTKLTGEQYCSVFNEVYGLPTVCLRYFNVFGPRQDPNSRYSAVIPKFVNCIGTDRPPEIYGDGEQTRDFTFVVDVVSANILAATGNATGVYNIGCSRNTSLNDLVKYISEATGKDIRPVYREPRAGDVKDSPADISRAGEFGYKPQWTLGDGLRETIKALLHSH